MNKSILLITIISIVSATFHSSLNAAISPTLIASEDFDYIDGMLANNNGGVGWSTPWGDANGNAGSNAMEVISNSVSITNGTLFRGLSNPFPNSGDVWMSFDYQFNAGIFDGIQLFNGTIERALIGGLGIFGVPPGVWTLARDASPMTATGSSVSSTTPKTGVLRFDIDAGTGDLWVGDGVGPVNITEAPVATIIGLSLAGVDTIRLGTAGNSFIDSIRIGTSSLDVAAVPEPSTTAAFMSGVALLVYLSRRRKKSKYKEAPSNYIDM